MSDPLKDAVKGCSLAVLLAMRLHASLDRNVPPTGDFRVLVVYGDRMRAHTNACLKFNSSRVVGQRVLYLGNGADDRSQTWSKVSSKVIYSTIAIFVKIAIWRVFPDTVM